MMITTILEPLNYKHHPHMHKTINSQKTTSQISLLPRNSSVTTVASSWREISAFNSARDLKTEPIDSEIFLRSLISLGFDSPNDLNIIVYNEWKYWDLQLDHTCKKWNHVWKLLATRSFTSFSLNLPRKLVDTHDARMDAIHELHQIRNDLHSLKSSWVLDTCIMHEHIQRKCEQLFCRITINLSIPPFLPFSRELEPFPDSSTISIGDGTAIGSSKALSWDANLIDNRRVFRLFRKDSRI